MKRVTLKKKTALSKMQTEWPKYTASLMNLSNSIGNKTSKANIGPLFEYFDEFKNLVQLKQIDYSIEGWASFYLKKHDGEQLIRKAVDKNMKTLDELREAINKIDYEMMQRYIEDLVFKKTFLGMDIEKIVANMLATTLKISNEKLVKSNSKDESKGIDYWLDGVPVQVKPYESYKGNSQNVIKSGLVVYYSANKEEDEVTIYFDEEKFFELRK